MLYPETYPVAWTTNAVDPLRVAMAAHSMLYWLAHRQATLWAFDVAEVWTKRLRVAVLAMADGAGVYAAARALAVEARDVDGSQRARHVEAVDLAAGVGARYVWSVDDDVVPRPECDLAVAAALMDAHPDYWLVALDLPSCPLPHGADGAHGPPIQEAGAVGACRILRVDALRGFAWPAMEPRYGPRYDLTLCAAIRAAGGKVGFFGDGAPRHLRATHLGEFASTLHPHYARLAGAGFPRRWDE